MMIRKSNINFIDGGKSRGIILASSLIAKASAALIYSAIFMIIISIFLPLAASAENKSPAPAVSTSEAKSEQKTKPTVNRITDAAMKSGVKSCLERIDQVSNFLTANTESGWLMSVPGSEPDRRLISASIEVATKEAPSAYASESFAPNQANGCAGMYETVVYWESGCPDVGKKQFSTFKTAGVLSKSISILDGGAGVRVFLMPAGRGCVAIKKEVLQ
jgi:hypothetical protein